MSARSWSDSSACLLMVVCALTASITAPMISLARSGELVLVAHELAHVERRHVVEIQARLAFDEGLEGDAGGLLRGVLLEQLGLGQREHAV